MLIKFILQFVIGFGVGIYGYLIPSYINLGVFQMSMERSSKSLMKVLVIISIIEIPYCFLCMSGMQWIMQQTWLLSIIKWLIVIVLLLVAYLTFRDAKKEKKQNDLELKPMDSSQINKLLVYAIFNPFQLSAWAIWGTYFIEKTWFDWTTLSIFIFSIGASLGVLLILWLYAIMGRKLVSYFSENKQKIDYGISGILVLLAVIQIVRNIL